MVGYLRTWFVRRGEQLRTGPELVRGRSGVAVFGGQVAALDRVAWIEKEDFSALRSPFPSLF